ncbi:30S ribosomal protein THX [Hymenobacter sp. 5414T-23]|nr:30S ribosomal protein THX [Hymenobacter sp. 5414T-23]UOQ81125.1 30S ribosomal protein THX [Hymenobacter sp. 5414T-23]
MGKGDIKTQKGKRSNGSYGVHRKKRRAAKAAAPKPTDKK